MAGNSESNTPFHYELDKLEIFMKAKTMRLADEVQKCCEVPYPMLCALEKCLEILCHIEKLEYEEMIHDGHCLYKCKYMGNSHHTGVAGMPKV